MSKKIFGLCLIVFLICLAGCEKVSSNKEMRVIEIKVYDSDNNLVESELRRYDMYLLTKLSMGNIIEKTPINSPAPYFRFEYVEADYEKSYKVEFIFQSLEKIDMTSLTLSINKSTEDLLVIDDIKKEDDYIIATHIFDDLSEEKHYFQLFKWESQDEKFTFSNGKYLPISGVIFGLPGSDEYKDDTEW